LSGEYPALLRRRALAMLGLAERLLGEGEYDLAVLNAEYAAQLYVKQLLYRIGGEEYRGHNIRALLALLAGLLEDSGFRGQAEGIKRFTRSNRSLLAELEEGRVRAVYGVFEYTREQAARLVEAARKLVELLSSIEADIFG